MFANVCEGFIRSSYGEFWDWRFLGFLASLRTRLLGGGRWRYYYCIHWKERQATYKTACSYFWFHDYFKKGEPYVQALVGRPSMVIKHVWFIGLRQGLRRNCMQKQRETSFSPFLGFSDWSEF